MIVKKRGFLLVLFIVCFLLASCKESPKKLTLGMIPVRDAGEMKQEFESIRLYLEKKLDMPVELVVTENYADLVEKMKSGQIDIGWYGAFSYIAAESEMDLIPLATEQRKKTGKFYQSYIITKRDAHITSLQELKGKRFAFVDTGSTSGFVMPYSLFISRNIDYQTYFSKIHYSNTHEQVPYDILNGIVDAGAVSSIFFEKMVKDKKIRQTDFDILWKSGDIPGILYAARADLNPKTIENFKKAIFKLPKENANGLQQFDSEIEKYIEVEDSDYNSIRNTSTILGKKFMYEQFLKSE